MLVFLIMFLQWNGIKNPTFYNSSFTGPYSESLLKYCLNVKASEPAIEQKTAKMWTTHVVLWPPARRDLIYLLSSRKWRNNRLNVDKHLFVLNFRFKSKVKKTKLKPERRCMACRCRRTPSLVEQLLHGPTLSSCPNIMFQIHVTNSLKYILFKILSFLSALGP